MNISKQNFSTEGIKQILESNGTDLFGFADITSIATNIRYDLPNAIAFAVSLNPKLIAVIPLGASKEYINEVDNVSACLDKIGENIADYLTSHGFKAKSFQATFDEESDEVLSTPFPHKTVAVLAGLGWIGKCALVINKKYGSAIRISKVLTDAPLPFTDPDMSVRCGKCGDCVDVCPGNALTGKNWSLGLPLEAYYDVHACNRAATERCEKATKVQDAYCGLCISACPWTQKYLKKSILGCASSK
jgi:epoxyqueuosine reductase